MALTDSLASAGVQTIPVLSLAISVEMRIYARQIVLADESAEKAERLWDNLKSMAFVAVKFALYTAFLATMTLNLVAMILCVDKVRGVEPATHADGASVGNAMILSFVLLIAIPVLATLARVVNQMVIVGTLRTIKAIWRGRQYKVYNRREAERMLDRWLDEP
jgi:hypothetical protein